MKAQAKPRTVGEYLAPLPKEQRAALQKLRRAIKAAAPGVQECIAYGIPAYRLNGRFIVGFGAAVKHCAFYPGAYPLEVHKAAVREYDLSKGTLRFPSGRPLPAALVRKLIKARIHQQEKR